MMELAKMELAINVDTEMLLVVTVEITRLSVGTRHPPVEVNKIRLLETG